MYTLVLLSLLCAAFGQNTSGPCMCAIPPTNPNVTLAPAWGRDYEATSCSFLSHGLCCDQAGEGRINGELQQFVTNFGLPVPCKNALSHLLCMANCFQATASFSKFTVHYNATTNMPDYHERYVYVSTAFADTVWTPCGAFATTIGFNTIEDFLSLFAGEAAFQILGYQPRFEPYQALYHWVVGMPAADFNELDVSTEAGGISCANDTYVAPPEVAPAPDAGSAPDVAPGDAPSDAPGTTPPTVPPTTPPTAPPSGSAEMMSFLALGSLLLAFF
eukprot:TRINITY_DN19318_c0_g1_i3.p1 TRINITY_DN19318_c0_g1~~TRINITY_DN19318_c0_g1_i3.p1  ORF type:complete len:274 (+),score=19.96 TRINITY_DN19318_c0_g1_i3:57-878(+)